MAKQVQPNYTPEQTKELVAGYLAGNTVAWLANQLNKSTRSVVAKLSAEGVYQPQTREAVRQPTKCELVAALEQYLGCECGVLESLQRADKPALQALVQSVTGVRANSGLGSESHT